MLSPACFLLLASNMLAQSEPQIDVKAMLAGLNDIKQKHTQSAKSQLSQTVSDFTAAAASDQAAAAFYLEAVRVTQFVGENREQTAFHDWKKKQSDKVNAAAVRTCLRYTLLSLQRAAGATDRQIFPGLLAYAQDTSALMPSIGDQQIVIEPVGRNIFARWYNLTEQLNGLSKWESSPVRVDQMYQDFLLPYMRKTRDPRILKYWDGKIADETARASNAAAAFSTDSFNQVRRPELLWSRAEDMVAIAMRNQGLSEMYSIVKSFPGHPEAGKWIEELKGLLLAPATPAGASPAPLADDASAGAPAAPAAPDATGGAAAPATNPPPQ
jgi:hypothetical protein